MTWKSIFLRAILGLVCLCGGLALFVGVSMDPWLERMSWYPQWAKDWDWLIGSLFLFVALVGYLLLARMRDDLQRWPQPSNRIGMSRPGS